MSHRFFFLPAQRQIYNRRVWNGVQCRPPLVTGRNNKPLAFRLIFLCFHCPLGGKPEPFVLVWPLFVWSKVATNPPPPPKVKMLPTGNFLFTLRAPPTAACRHFALLTSSFSFLKKRNFLLKQFILMIIIFLKLGFPSEWSGGYHLPYMAAAAAAGVNPFSHYGSPGKFN